MAGPVTDRFMGMTDEEVGMLSPEEKRDMKRQILEERQTPPEDRILGAGFLPDLEAVQRGLDPIPKGQLPTPLRFAANVALNVPRLGVDAAQMINNPVDTFRDLATLFEGGVKSGRLASLQSPAQYSRDQSQAQGPSPAVAEEDPSVQMYNEFRRGLEEQFTSEQFMDRPLDIPSMLLPLLRWARAPGVLRKMRLMKGGGKPMSPRMRRFIDDPGMAMLSEGGRTALKGLGRLKEPLAKLEPSGLKKIREATQTALEGQMVKGPMGVQQRMTGLTAGTGGKVQRLTDEAAAKSYRQRLESEVTDAGEPVRRREQLAKQGSSETQTMSPEERVIREHQGEKGFTEEGDISKGDRDERLIRKFITAADVVKERMKRLQDKADADLAPYYDQPVSSKALQKAKGDALVIRDDFNALVESVPGPSSSPAQHIAGRVPILGEEVPKGRKQVSFPEGGRTRISARGEGQALVAQRYKEFLELEPTVGEIHNFILTLDDDIFVFDTQIGRQANNALMALRGRLRKLIGDELGDVYEKKTFEYEKYKDQGNDNKLQLGIEPGVVSKRGMFQEGFNKETALGKIIDSVSDGEELAFKTLRRLEKESGTPYLAEGAVGTRTRSWFGGGLVAKAEAGQAIRKLAPSFAGLAALTVTGFAMPIMLVPLTVIGGVAFSPRALSIMRLTVAPKLRRQWDQGYAGLRKIMETASRQGAPVSQWMMEGVTVGQFVERIKRADPGLWEQEQQEQQEQQEPNQSFLGKMGSIDTNPLTGVKLER